MLLQNISLSLVSFISKLWLLIRNLNKKDKIEKKVKWKKDITLKGKTEIKQIRNK